MAVCHRQVVVLLRARCVLTQIELEVLLRVIVQLALKALRVLLQSLLLLLLSQVILHLVHYILVHSVFVGVRPEVQELGQQVELLLEAEHALGARGA